MSRETPAGRNHLLVADAGVVRIRAKHPDDVHNDYAWRLDAELLRYDAGSPIDMTFEEFAAQHLQDIQFPRTDRRNFSLESAQGLHIGNCMYYNADPIAGQAELGISIALAQYRGHGLGRAAVVAFVRFLFTAHAFRRVILHTLDWNERAIRCFERTGFSHAAIVEREGIRLVRMEARREWWLLWDMEGRFETVAKPPPGRP